MEEEVQKRVVVMLQVSSATFQKQDKEHILSWAYLQHSTTHPQLYKPLKTLD